MNYDMKMEINRTDKTEVLDKELSIIMSAIKLKITKLILFGNLKSLTVEIYRHESRK